MASLLRDPLFEISGQAPPPIQHFYYFSVTKTNVIWRWWKISPRVVDRHEKPGELKKSFENFLDDHQLQGEVSGVFGQRVLEYSKALCQGRFDYLEHLPDFLILRILTYLELEDVIHIGQTSRKFKRLCASEEFWEQALRQCSSTVSAEVESLASEVGWRSIFFTSKLQLQKLINRRRLLWEVKQAGRLSDSDFPDKSSGENQLASRKKKSNPDKSNQDVIRRDFTPCP